MSEDFETAMHAAEADMCPNCVTPWKCNGPHLNGGVKADLALAHEGAEHDQARIAELEAKVARVEAFAEFLANWPTDTLRNRIMAPLLREVSVTLRDELANG